MMTSQAYHAWAFDRERPAEGPISASLLKRFIKQGPLAFRYGPEFKETPAMLWGSLVDCLAFTPCQFPTLFAAKEDCPHLSPDGGFRSKDAKAWRDSRTSEGVYLIDRLTEQEARIAVERLESTPIAAEIMHGAQFQVDLTAEIDGIPAKSLLDVVPWHLDHDDSLADLKTTACNLYDDSELYRQVRKFGYHVQAAFYLQMWKKVYPKDTRRRFHIIWQSSTSPYEVRVTEIGEGLMNDARAEIAEHLPRLVECCKNDSWPSKYSQTISELD